MPYWLRLVVIRISKFTIGAIFFSAFPATQAIAAPPVINHSISNMECSTASYCTYQYAGAEVIKGNSTSIQLLITTTGSYDTGSYNTYEIGVATKPTSSSLSVVAPSAGSASATGTVKIATGSASTSANWSLSVASTTVLKDLIGGGATHLVSAHRMTITINPDVEGDYAINLTATTHNATGDAGTPSTITYFVKAKSYLSFAGDNFTLAGNAVATGSTVALTPDENTKKGAVFSKSRINLGESFTINAELNFGSNDSLSPDIGADGIAFVLQPNSVTTLSSGGGLGYDGVDNAFAVEFDTYDNGGQEAGKGDHAGLMKSTATKHDDWINVGSSVISLTNIEDGNWYRVEFSWQPKISAGSSCGDNTKGKFTAKIDKNRNGNFADAGEVLYDQICIALEGYFSSSGSQTYYGFTAATGGAKNLQQVRALESTVSARSNTPPTIAAITNQKHAVGTSQRSLTVSINDDATSSAQWNIQVTSSDTNVVTVGSSGTPPTVTGTAQDQIIRYRPSASNTGTSTLTVTITDADGATATTSFTVTLGASLSITTPTSGLNGTLGSAFSLPILASGGTESYTFSKTGALPPGVTLNSSTGVISGTPTTAGSYPITVTVTDSDSTQATTSSFTLTIANPPSNIIPSATVTFAPNGADNIGSYQTELLGETKALKANTLIRAGHEFAGWNTKADGTGVTYSDRQLFKFDQSLVLYAQWKFIKLVPVITWSNPTPISAATPLSSSQLNASANVSGVCNYTPALGSLLMPGVNTLRCDFTPTDSSKFESVSKSVEITVLPLPTIKWEQPGQIVRGTPLTASQLNAVGSVPGRINYSPDLGALLPSGINTLTAELIPENALLPAVKTQVSIRVIPALQPSVDQLVLISGRYGVLDIKGVSAEMTYTVTSIGRGIERVTKGSTFVGISSVDGFTGNTSLTLLINDEERVIELIAAVLVLPPKVRGTYILVEKRLSNVSWSGWEGSKGYKVIVSNEVVCDVPAVKLSCEVDKVLGPNSMVQIQNLGDDNTSSELADAVYMIPSKPIRIEVVNFATAKSSISSRDRSKINSLVMEMTDAGYSNFVVVGHTDSVQGINNMKLSRDRANSVRRSINRASTGLEVEIQARSLREPSVTNSTSRGRAENRRAEIFIRG